MNLTPEYYAALLPFLPGRKPLMIHRPSTVIWKPADESKL